MPQLELTQEEIAILKNVATAFSNATTIGGLSSIEETTTADDITIEALENNTSRKANLGALLRKSCLPKVIDVENDVETLQVGSSEILSFVPAALIVYDTDGVAHAVTIRYVKKAAEETPEHNGDVDEVVEEIN